ncbi:ABC transporter permease [Chitinophaga lutea]
MNKIWIIIKREYLTRVRKKSFLVVTLLLPLLFAGMMVVPALFINSGGEEKVAVVDDSGIFTGKLADDDGIHYKFLDAKADTLKNSYLEMGYTGLLHIPKMDIERPSNIIYYSKGQVSLRVKGAMERRLENVLEDKRMEAAGIDKTKLEGIRTDLDITNLSGKEERKGSAGVAFIVGYAAGFIIYIVLLVFGMMVMRGVMEEKMNRIAEVMVSSVRPFQLMMGKIVGIAAVGLTQFLIWIFLIIGLYWMMAMMLGPEMMQAAAQSNASSANNAAAMEMAKTLTTVAGSVNWWVIVPCFLFYFLGGYLFYASLFAAAGSLVNEDPNEAQSLTFPITLPIILSIVVLMSVINNPNGTLAFWGSIIPLTSPVVMIARLPYGVPGTVPYWELALSMALLIAGFLGTTWMAGRIYRTGILLYGKKVTLKEAVKLVFSKS